MRGSMNRSPKGITEDRVITSFGLRERTMSTRSKAGWRSAVVLGLYFAAGGVSAQQPPWPPPMRPGFPPPPRQDQVRLVSKWYDRYLHRQPDPQGLQSCLIQLRNGETHQGVQAGLLGSDEYWQQHGSNPAGFIAGLYSDVLHQRPAPRRLGYWVNRLNQNGGNPQQTAPDLLNW